MGGDHKCPLCDATFTRPQHVGRHFRSHTGDRPYQCKECPQAFARSDLLSRHVNKAHRVPEEGGKPATTKKGRRKSMPSSAHPRSKDQTTDEVKPKRPINRHRSSSLAEPPRASVKAEPTEQHPALQAQSMYPHHPLLANPDLQTAPPQPSQTSPQWDGFNVSPNAPGMMAAPLAPDGALLLDQSMQGQFKFPMRLTESDQGVGSSSMGRQNGSSVSYEYVKKRACDQCSHSKVRCDFAEPCQRCTSRNVLCSYTKTPKSRSLSMFPAQRAAYPSSPYRSTTLPINSPYSPLAFTPSPLNNGGMPPPTARNSLSPTSVASALMPGAPQIIANAWSPNSAGTSAPSPMNQQMLQAPRPMVPVQPLPTDPNGVPISMNSFTSVNLPMSHLAPTPSLTSMTTSPSGSDELFERRGSLSGSLTFTSNYVDPSTATKGASQPSVPPTGPVQLQTPVQIPYAQIVQPDMANYTFGRIEGTVDPRIQFRNPAAIEDEDDVVAPLTAIPNSATPLGQDNFEDMQQLLNQRRRSSAHIWGFNDMSLDPKAKSDNPIPDPFTASMVAQEHQRKLQQLQQQHMAANAAGPGNATLAPQSLTLTPEQMATAASGRGGEAKELWKAFMEPMADQSAPPGHYQPQGSLIALNPHQDSRPNMAPRSLSKSSSMPDLQSPIVEAATLNLQPDQPPRSRVAQDDADAMKQWRSEIRDRQSQSSFSLAPGQSATGSKMKFDPAMFLNAATAARNSSRPMASVFQHSSALEQTLAPERTPSFGNENLPTPARAAFASSGNNSFSGKSPRSSLGNNALVPPPSSGGSNTGWSWKTTSAAARPGNKRLASQTLVGDPPKIGKMGATFGFWDDEDDTASFGGLAGGAGELKVG